MINEQRCPLCSCPKGLRIGLDKNGLPYSRCWGCGTQIFFKSAMGIGGLRRLARAVGEGVLGPLEGFSQEVEAEGQQFIRLLHTSGSDPVKTGKREVVGA